MDLHTRRAHVGINLRDPGLNVADINNYRPAKIKTLFKGGDAANGATSSSGEGCSSAQPPAAQQQRRARPGTAPASRSHHQQQHPSPPGLPPGFHYTGLPLFQARPEEVLTQRAAAEQALSGAPGSIQAAVNALGREQAQDLSAIDGTMDRAKAQQHERETGAAHRARLAVADGKQAARQAATQVGV